MSKTNHSYYTKPGAPFSDDHTPGVWPGKDLWRSYIWVFPEYKIIKKCMERDHSPTAVKDGVDALVEITKHVVAKIDYSKEYMGAAYESIMNDPKENEYEYTLDCSHLQSASGEPHSWIERHINVVWYSILSLGLAMPASQQPKLLDFIFELNTRHVPHPDPEIERYLTTTHNSMWFDASLPGVWISHRLFEIIDRADLQAAQGEPLFERNLDGLITLAAQLYLRRHDSDEPDSHPPHQARHFIAYKYWIPWSTRKLIHPVVQPFFNAPWHDKNRPEPLIRACSLWISYLAPFIYQTCITAETSAIMSGKNPDKLTIESPCLLSYSKWRNGLVALLKHQQPTFNPYVYKRKRLSESTEDLLRAAIDAMNRAEQRGPKLDPTLPRWDIVAFLRRSLILDRFNDDDFIYSYDEVNARPRWLHKDVYNREMNITPPPESDRIVTRYAYEYDNDGQLKYPPRIIYAKNTSSPGNYKLIRVYDSDVDIDGLRLNSSDSDSDSDSDQYGDGYGDYPSDNNSVRSCWSYCTCEKCGFIPSEPEEEHEDGLKKKENNTDQFERRVKAHKKTMKGRIRQGVHFSKAGNGKNKATEHDSKSSKKGKGTGKEKPIERELDLYYGKPAKWSPSDEEGSD